VGTDAVQARAYGRPRGHQGLELRTRWNDALLIFCSEVRRAEGQAAHTAEVSRQGPAQPVVERKNGIAIDVEQLHADKTRSAPLDPGLDPVPRRVRASQGVAGGDAIEIRRRSQDLHEPRRGDVQFRQDDCSLLVAPILERVSARRRRQCASHRMDAKGQQRRRTLVALQLRRDHSSRWRVGRDNGDRITGEGSGPAQAPQCHVLKYGVSLRVLVVYHNIDAVAVRGLVGVHLAHVDHSIDRHIECRVKPLKVLI
jgi:hypothetical protein